MSDDLNAPDVGREDRLERLYEEALALPEEERDDFLDRACAGDPELRAELASLLLEAAAAHTFMEDLGRLVPPSGHAPPDRLVRALADRYHIEERVGAGGMATVYRARDLRHERKVALKVLKPELAAIVGGERFLAEIKTTANLQHPNILPLFDSGEAGGYLYYVMPYVEGESLRARMDREAQLPVDEAVRIATSMAEALDYAHRQGVIHRDIKPANVLLPDGKPVIADFGIALAIRAGGGDRLTETGLSLGTPHYMSPEQATGDQHIGPATDIYALGCVLYEMLVAEPPYTGGTPQSVLGKIISGEPDPITRHRRSVPTNVEAAIRKALEKVPADRFREAREFGRALGDPGFRHGDPAESAATGGPGLWKPMAMTLAALTAMLTSVLVWSLQRPSPPGPVARFAVPFAAGTEPAFGWTVSADGSLLIFHADGRLWGRRLSSFESFPIPGSEGGQLPSVSPDGELLAFSQSGQVRVAAIDGSASRPIMEGQWPRWGRDGYVYAATADGLARVRAEGGTAEIVVRRRPDEAGPHIFVDEIPAGILFGIGRGFRHELLLLRSDTGEREPILSVSTFERKMQLLPSGHLLYLEDGVLTGDVFDFDALELAGQPVPLVEGVSWFFVSDNGRLVYWPPATAVEAEFIWVTRSGAVTRVDPGWSVSVSPRTIGFALSSDDRRLAFQDGGQGNEAIWVKELPSGEPMRMTFDAPSVVPRWGPDDASLTFPSLRGDAGLLALWSLRTDRTGTPETLFSDADYPVAKGFWSPDGEWLIMRTTPGAGGVGFSVGGRDIIGLRPGVADQPVELVASDAAEHQPELSPDGNWLAYMSNQLGEPEVFVRPFPDVDSASEQVSLEGGIAPFWAHGGREIFFVEPATRALMSAEFEASPGFRILDRRAVMTLSDDIMISDVGQPYDVTRDDQTFLMLRTIESDSAPEQPVLVAENWVQELYERLPN